MHYFLMDLKHSARMFLRTPSFTIAAIAASALGIAANTAIFSVVNTVLLKPFAYRDSARIVMFQNVFPTGRFGSASPTEFNWWRQKTEAFEDVSAYDFDVANLTGESFPEQIPTMHVSADFFRLCGANAVLGRTFAPADDLPNAPKAVVLAYGFWQRQFGSDPLVIGRRISLNGERYEIIGVVGSILQNGQITERSTLSGDIETHEPPYVYLPFQIDPNSGSHGHHFNAAGRLKPGFTVAAANAQLQASYQEYVRRWPEEDSPGMGFAVQPLQAAIVGGVRNSLLMLWGAVGFVLLIACANVANLLLARATGRKREIAVRAAVGAGRARILRQLLTESVMLSLTGGVVGVTTGYAGIRAILSFVAGSIPRIGTGGANVSLDWQVLGFTAALSILTGILFGLVPALQSSRADLSSTLKQSSGGSGTGFRQNRTRAVLVTCEIGLAVVLMVGAALLIRSFIAIRQVNPGFDPHNTLTMRMSITGPQFDNAARTAQVIHEGLQRIRVLPGVAAAAVTCCVPLEDRFQGRFQIVGRPEGPTSGGVTGTNVVSEGYFDVFRIPIVRGRTFTEQDESGPPVVIINQALAKRFWPNGDPLQDKIIVGVGEEPHQIIGVVGDVHDAFLNREPRLNVYRTLRTGAGTLEGMWAWVIRTHVEPTLLSSASQKELLEASGGLPLAQVRTMEETLSRSMSTENFSTLVLTIFACAALLLAAIGIYGLMAYSVGQRAREIGVRLAVGAEIGQIRNMFLFEGLRLALAGVVCGIAAALGLTRLVSSFLFGVKEWDPLVFLGVPIVLVAVALLAVWTPAMHAGRVDPIHALRHD